MGRERGGGMEQSQRRRWRPQTGAGDEGGGQDSACWVIWGLDLPSERYPVPGRGAEKPTTFFFFCRSRWSFPPRSAAAGRLSHQPLSPGAAPAAIAPPRGSGAGRPPVLPPPGDSPEGRAEPAAALKGKTRPRRPSAGGARPNPPRAPFPGAVGGCVRALSSPRGRSLLLRQGLASAAPSEPPREESGPQRRGPGGGGFKVARGSAEPPACAAG